MLRPSPASRRRGPCVETDMQPDLTDEDIETLDTFLMSEQAPEDCMLISDLDGFLTAIAIGPEPVPQADWMPVVWAGDEPAFADAAQAERFQGRLDRKRAGKGKGV